jgi:nitrogenase molybdenum-iron protein alpha/beta subunit
MPIKSYEHGCSTTQALATLGKVEGVIPLLHGPQTCVFQNQISTLYCRPANLLTAGTLVSKSEVIFGGDDSLKEQIRNVYKAHKPRVIVIINTCIPQLNGDDVEGVIVEMEREFPGLRLSTLNTGFNYTDALLRGSDEAWVALLKTLEQTATDPGSVGLIGRSGQDADNMGAIDTLLRKAGLKTHLFPATHIDEMARITSAEHIYPLHLGTYATSQYLTEEFGCDVEFIEIPAGVGGTSRFLRAVADRESCQALHDIVDQEEARVLPELEKIKAQFAKDKVRMLLVSGPANEMSMGKIVAEFGAEVYVVPSMKDKFYKQERAIMEERYGVNFIDEDFDSLEDLIGEIQPTVIANEFQAQPESSAHFIPSFCIFFYLADYGYDYALNFGRNFANMTAPAVWQHWRDMRKRFGPHEIAVQERGVH